MGRNNIVDMKNLKKQIRPTITSILTLENSGSEETFQNNILRPIIKLQHDLILTYFQYYLNQKKININDLDSTLRKDIIRKLFKTDTRLKIELRGLIIGLLTVEELKEYLTQLSGLNKRINNMIEQRIKSCYIK